MLCTQSLLLRSGLQDLGPADPAVWALLVRRRGTCLAGEYTDGLASARERGRSRAAGTWISRSQGQRQYSDRRAVPYKRGRDRGTATVSILARLVSMPFGGKLGGEVIDGVS